MLACCSGVAFLSRPLEEALEFCSRCYDPAFLMFSNWPKSGCVLSGKWIWPLLMRLNSSYSVLPLNGSTPNKIV